MGILKDLYKAVKDKLTVKGQEKFEKLSETEKKEEINKALKLKTNDKALAKTIENKPYLLAHLIAELNANEENILPLVDIALNKGVSIYDLLDKNTTLSNAQLVNFAVANHPEVLFEIEDKEKYSNLLSGNTIIEAFKKNPEVMFSDAKVLDEKIVLTRKDEKGELRRRNTTLRTQLKRALNLYFRPEAYSERNFDYFASEIANGIKSESFVEKVQGNKMTTRVTTAANETLKRNPEKGRVLPASALHMNRNKVMYVIPNEARRKAKNTKSYENYHQHLFGLLNNPALNTAKNDEKVRLVKRCVSIVPELYFDLDSVEAYNDVLNKLTVQLTTFETFKKQHKNNEADSLLAWVGTENEKKVLARAKANKTRKANREKKAKLEREEEKQLELK